MLAVRIRGAVSLVALAAAAACGSSEPSGPSTTTPSAIARVSGNGQVGLVGQPLSLPLVVKVTGASSTPIKGASVTFAVTFGAATVSPTTTTTDSLGQAKTTVTLGSAAGSDTITATVAGTSLVTTFVVTAGTNSVVLACSTGAPQAPGVGGVLPGVSGSGVCLSGGSTGADYAIVAFYGNPDSSAVASFTATAHGAVALNTASLAPLDVTSLSPVGQYSTNRLQAEFDARLRETSRRALTAKIPAARAWNRQRAAFSAIPAAPAIGTLFTLNANGNNPCTSAINVTARVAAVSSLAIVVADTANPAGGFTDAEYASFAAQFDTLISPLDIQNFGQPSDVDKNGKTIIFFTKEVNKLTPRGANGVIGGFFFERDLFPKSDSLDLQGCPTSNVAEMYYSMVPDPNGQFSDIRKKTDVQNLTPGTLVHEFQHLINAGRRLYVNNADAFEDVWLNEGLSHIAEELLYYRVSGLAPRRNISTNTIRSDPPTSINNFNNYQGDNFGRYEVFLGKPSQTSVYAGNDSLETRGATWNLLRYLADHRGSSDADTWLLLDNTKLTGQQNLASVFGSNYMTQIRDWATSVFSDDVAGVTDARFLEPSWNMRNIFPQLVSPSGVPLNRFPLAVVPLSDAAPANLSVFAGGAAYLRFSVPAGSQASIDWSSGGLPVSGLMQFTVVRSR